MKYVSKIKCYFITGTGRCGTKLLTKIFSLSKNSVCEHEKIFRHASMLKFYQNNDVSLYNEDIYFRLLPQINLYNKACKSYGISSGHMYFTIPYLYKILGQSTRFILLVRRPEEFVRSALARGFFDSTHPNACIQILPNTNDEIFEKWDTISAFEKNLWYWKLVNQFVINEFRKMPNNIYKIVRIEDVNKYLAKELCNFLDLSDIGEGEMQKILNRRINASPGLGDGSDVNQWSLPISLDPIEKWNNIQLDLLKKYTGQLCSELYGSKT